MGVSVTDLGVHNANEIERGITKFVREPKGGLIVSSHRILLREAN